MKTHSPEIKANLQKRRALIREAIERGRQAKWIGFDTAVNMEIQNFGENYVRWFIRGYEQ